MSIANEIRRIQEARDTLRAKAVALGVGLSTDNITQLATKYDGIVDRGTPNAEVKDGESVTLSAGYYHGGSIKGVGGGAPSLQSKSVTYTANGTNTITPDEGDDGLSSVDVTVDVASGGGGGGDIGGVSFIDYDGTIVETWALSDLANKTELPTPPVHDRLVFQQWNWTLEDIKAANAEMVVGALYTTTSGLTEFHIRVTKASGLAIECNMVGNKNWGDGTEDALTSHTYADYGDYIITCDGNTIVAKVMGDTAAAQQTLLRISIPNSVTIIRAKAFYNCRALQSISIPNSVTGIGDNAFLNCYTLQSISIPNGVTSIWNSTLYNCYALQSISIHNSVTAIWDNTFYNCFALQSISIPNSVTNIGTNAFGLCFSSEYDFSKFSRVPTLGTDAFKGILSSTKILVPSSLYDTWVAATNWTIYANYIVAV